VIQTENQFLLLNGGKTMGTINYGTNKYITMGINLNDFDELNDFDKEYEFEFLSLQVQEYLDRYDFDFYTVSIEPGYYDGFYIKIESCENWSYVDNSQERNDVLKETTQLKQFLFECLEIGLVSVHPGWCTAYLNINESKKEINTAIKAMKDHIKSLPTYKQLKK
jgi:hypothetical protein